MTKCRTGCPTQDHKSYAECARGLQLAVGNALSLAQKEWDSELALYRAARAEGIQPDGTTREKIEYAKKESDRTGVAYGV